MFSRKNTIPLPLHTNEKTVSQFGSASAHAHHGELFQGKIRYRGRLLDALITLPIHSRRSHATFFPSDAATLSVIPAKRTKARVAATLALAYLQRPPGGTLVIDSGIPLRWGMGSSTADVVAAIRAVSLAVGVALRESEIAAIAVRAEGASDPLMLADAPCLFAHREGFVIERLAGGEPPFTVVSIVPKCLSHGMDTLDLPHIDYTPREIAVFQQGYLRLRHAYRHRNLAAIGDIATDSAAINQKYRPKPAFEELKGIARQCGALGIQVAHSGSVIGLLFRHPSSSDELRGIERSLLAIERLNSHHVQLFGL